MALMMALITGTLASAVVGGGGAKMECGGVPLCGVLTLESGNGEGYYNHKEPTVHGLWPEVGAFGDSSCSSPTESSADPTTVYPCYSDSADDTADDSHQLSFESHEWASHGMCAGVKDAEDYFSQVCALSSAPLATMTGVKSAGGGLEEMATALKASGYEVFNIDTYNSQVELSACAKPPGVWVLSPIANFSQACGGWPKTGGGAGSCEASKKGPLCNTNADCLNTTGCLRCAKSGYCTDVPLVPRDGDGNQGHTNGGGGTGTCKPNLKGPHCSADADCFNTGGCVRCARSGFCTDTPLTTNMLK
mmetsp:Transcript_59253/g.134154  ORF Transcript_59253/g.134154 Transcript_59253/m.134154 type:complete len:305 (-) Transcript_59253:117-1031(-)